MDRQPRHTGTGGLTGFTHFNSLLFFSSWFFNFVTMSLYVTMQISFYYTIFDYLNEIFFKPSITVLTEKCSNWAFVVIFNEFSVFVNLFSLNCLNKSCFSLFKMQNYFYRNFFSFKTAHFSNGMIFSEYNSFYENALKQMILLKDATNIIDYWRWAGVI